MQEQGQRRFYEAMTQKCKPAISIISLLISPPAGIARATQFFILMSSTTECTPLTPRVTSTALPMLARELTKPLN